MVRIRMSLRALVPIAAVVLTGCDAIFPNTAGFRQVRYYATGEVRAGTLDYSVLFCPDGRVDMNMPGYGVRGTYEVDRHTVLVRTRYNEVRFQLSPDRNTLTPDAGGASLIRDPSHEESEATCVDETGR